jgi:hypothetical protein
MGLVTIGDYDYSLRLSSLAHCTHLLRCWPLAMQPPRPAPRILPEEQERTPQRLARIPLPPPLRWVIPIPGQVRRFPAEYTTGCQPSMTTKPNVLLGKDLHLQARPDYRHGWGAEDAGDVDQSSLGRRLLLGLSSRWLFSDNSGWFSAPLSNWGLACQLRHELLHGGGWGYLQPALPPYPNRLRPPAIRGRKVESPASNGVSSSAHYIEKQVLDYPTQGSLPPGMWSL